MDSTTRFSDRVEDYAKYRPHYPPEIILYLNMAIGLTDSRVVADIGSGTGISTEMFLRNGNKVYGVEPNNEMRKKAEHLLQSYSNFISINGTAEQTTLNDDSIDVIVAGQAFHWFDRATSKTEFQRIGRPDAWIVLMWNDRRMESEFEQAYENLILRHALDYAAVNHKRISEEVLRMFFLPHPFTTKTFPNEQVFDFTGLKGRLLSSSYIPNKEHPKYDDMISELHEMYARYQTNDRVRFGYMTTLYVGKAK